MVQELGRTALAHSSGNCSFDRASVVEGPHLPAKILEAVQGLDLFHKLLGNSFPLLEERAARGGTEIQSLHLPAQFLDGRLAGKNGIPIVSAAQDRRHPALDTANALMERGKGAKDYRVAPSIAALEHPEHMPPISWKEVIEGQPRISRFGRREVVEPPHLREFPHKGLGVEPGTPFGQ